VRRTRAGVASKRPANSTAGALITATVNIAEAVNLDRPIPRYRDSAVPPWQGTWTVRALGYVVGRRAGVTGGQKPFEREATKIMSFICHSVPGRHGGSRGDTGRHETQ